MTAATAAAAGRRLAASLMQDTCTITRPAAPGGSYDPATDTWTPATGSQAYAGPCRVRRAAAGGDTRSGDQPIATAGWTVSVPAGTPAAPGDLVQVTAGGPATPVGLLRVTAVGGGTHVTATRLDCTEDTP